MKTLNFLKIIVGTTSFFTLLSLTGCSSIYGPHGLIPEDNGQYQKAQTNAPLTTPPNIQTSDAVPYYGIPPTTQSNALPPSLVPPGSGLPPERQFFERVPQGATKPLFARLKHAETGQPVLAANTNFITMWNALPAALQSAGYRLIHQNQALGIDYVLDPSQTGGRLTKNTPIIQVHVTTVTPTQIELTLTDNSNQPLPIPFADSMLTRLQHTLLNPQSNSLWQRTVGAMFGVIK